MAINSYQREMYKSSLKHAERKNHKYLYKIGDRYIYPEDVKSTNPRQKANLQYQHLKKSQEVGKEQERERSGRKYKINSEIENRGNRNSIVRFRGEGYKAGRNEIDQIHSAHQRATKELDVPVHYKNGGDGVGRDLYINRSGRASAPSLDKKVLETSERKKEKKRLEERKKINQQANSAHEGYYKTQEKFPDGGSTEELERQKRKTKARKSRRKLGMQSGEIKTAFQSKPDYSKKSKDIDQINSAHRESTQKRNIGEDTPHKLLVDVNPTGDPGNLEREKRKTALRKRHKK